MVPEITVQELKEKRENNDDFVLIDVREPYEYDICHIDGDLIPLNDLEEKVKVLDQSKEYVVHCKMGGRSAKAVEFMLASGFENVSNLKGGISEWIDKIDPMLESY